MKLAIDALIEGIERMGNPTAVGLDTQLAHLPEGFAGKVESFADGIFPVVLEPRGSSAHVSGEPRNERI